MGFSRLNVHTGRVNGKARFFYDADNSEYGNGESFGTVSLISKEGPRNFNSY